jgi:photosystem II stability/assembly factor-like uncharacterized protein
MAYNLFFHKRKGSELSIFLFAVILCSAAHSQNTNQDWELLNPKLSANTGVVISFLNNTKGFILNNKQIISTSDCGTNWEVQTEIISGTDMAFKDNYGYVIGNSGIVYKSTYMGEEWNLLNTNFTENLTGVSVISADTVFISGSRHCYYSFDSGNTWNTSNITTNTITCSYFTNSSVGYVGCSNGSVYKTIDGGITWMLNRSVNYMPADIHKIYFVNDDTGFISMGHNTLLKTTDAGETWNEIAGTSDKIYNFYFLNAQVGFIVGEHGVIFKTTNGGNTWTWVGFQNGRYYGTDLYGIYFLDNLTGFAVGMRGRILKTTNGGNSWNDYPSIYNDIKQLKFMSDTIAFGLVGNSFIKTTDGGIHWENIGAPISTGNTRNFDFVDENIGYCIAGGEISNSTNVAKICKTTNGGISWTTTNNGKDLMIDDLYSIAFVDATTGFASGGYNHRATYKTTNGGNTWTQLNNDRFGQMQFINASIGYARNTGYYTDHLYKTTDGGDNWTSTFAIDDDITSFYFLDENIGYFVGDAGLMYKTTDGGTTWQKVSVPYVYYVNVKFLTPNIGFITDDYGKTYQTNNGGASWEPLQKPYSVQGIELIGDKIFAFGANGIILRKTIEYDPVSLTLNNATEITNTSATLIGNVASNSGVVTNIKLVYRSSLSNDTIPFNPDSVLPNENITQSLHLENLAPNTSYSYKLIATYNGAEYSSNTLQFITLPDYELYLNYIYEVSSNEAVVSGQITSNANEITNIEFQYSTDTAFDLSVSAQPNRVLGGNAETISARLVSLLPQTRYNVRIKAVYNNAVIYSDAISFTTPEPYRINLYRPYINGNNATIDFAIQANKDTIKNIFLEYGTTREYNNHVSIEGQVAKGWFEYYSAQITQLDSATVYYYRIKADMGNEIIYSSENILKLQGGIVITPIEFVHLSDNSILLQGLMNSNGTYLSNIRFYYGQNEVLEDSVIATPYHSYDYATKLISARLDNLTPDVQYYGQISALDYYANQYYYSERFPFMLSSSNLDNIKDDNSILLYPNPASNLFTIEPQIDKIEIYDLQGKFWLTVRNENTVNVSQSPVGLYFVKIFSNNQIFVKKLIINR